jgi:hypothetical protein
VLADLQAGDAMAAQLLTPEAASSPAAHAEGSQWAVAGSSAQAFADAPAGTEAAGRAAEHALATDCSMPQALSSSLAPVPPAVPSAAPLSAPLTASMPQASPLAEQNSTAGTAAFAGALDAEHEGVELPGDAAAAAEADAEAGLLPQQQLGGEQQLVGGSRKQGLTLRPARRSSASGQQGDRNSVAKRPWK